MGVEWARRCAHLVVEAEGRCHLVEVVGVDAGEGELHRLHRTARADRQGTARQRRARRRRRGQRIRLNRREVEEGWREERQRLQRHGRQVRRSDRLQPIAQADVQRTQSVLRAEVDEVATADLGHQHQLWGLRVECTRHEGGEHAHKGRDVDVGEGAWHVGGGPATLVQHTPRHELRERLQKVAEEGRPRSKVGRVTVGLRRAQQLAQLDPRDGAPPANTVATQLRRRRLRLRRRRLHLRLRLRLGRRLHRRTRVGRLRAIRVGEFD